MGTKCLKCWEWWRRWWKLGVPPTWLVISGAILLQVGFGFYPVMVRKFATSVNPLIFSFYRDLACFPLLLLCALMVERKLMLPNLKMTLVFMIVGMTGMFGSQLLFIVGVYLVGPNIASAFQPIIPVWATVLAVVTCTEKFPSLLYVHSWIKLLGIAMATGGAIELVLTGNKNTTHINSTLFAVVTNSSSTPHHPISLELLGYIALFGNTFCTAVNLLVQKRFIFDVHDNEWRHLPIFVTTYSYFFGALFMGLASIYYAASQKYDKFIVQGESIYALLYAVFVGSATCYMLITWANMHLSTTVVTAIWPTQVLVAVLASYFVTGDELAPFQYIGAVMLILSLFMVLFSNHMEEKQQEEKLKQRKGKDEKTPLLINDDVTSTRSIPSVN